MITKDKEIYAQSRLKSFDMKILLNYKTTIPVTDVDVDGLRSEQEGILIKCELADQ